MIILNKEQKARLIKYCGSAMLMDGETEDFLYDVKLAIALPWECDGVDGLVDVDIPYNVVGITDIGFDHYCAISVYDFENIIRGGEL